jgi:hypothetical protein
MPSHTGSDMDTRIFASGSFTEVLALVRKLAINPGGPQGNLPRRGVHARLSVLVALDGERARHQRSRSAVGW